MLLALAGLIGAADTEYLLLLVIGVVFIASQIFWLRRVIDLGERLIPGRQRRSRIAILVGLAYLLLVAYSFPTTIAQGHTFRARFERVPNIVADAAFWWWFVGSMAGFLLILGFGTVDLLARAAGWVRRRIGRVRQPGASVAAAAPPSTRREFMRKAAVLVSATPFVAAGYGLLYGREDVEAVPNRIRLARLPQAFRGFRIAQLADIHMGPFAGAAYLRRCVAITNELQPDVVALTGDFIAWETGYLREAVRTLGGLHAPHGVFGCLGNHESESGTEGLIAPLFAAEGIRMLRQEAATIQRAGEALNLIGIDDVRGETAAERREDLQRRLRRELVMPGVVNILLAHEPAGFILDRAAELGVDLVLAGTRTAASWPLDPCAGV
jgi:predicted MPP superfamily phosphohydrolase